MIPKNAKEASSRENGPFGRLFAKLGKRGSVNRRGERKKEETGRKNENDAKPADTGR